MLPSSPRVTLGDQTIKEKLQWLFAKPSVEVLSLLACLFVALTGLALHQLARVLRSGYGLSLNNKARASGEIPPSTEPIVVATATIAEGAFIDLIGGHLVHTPTTARSSELRSDPPFEP